MHKQGIYTNSISIEPIFTDILRSTDYVVAVDNKIDDEYTLILKILMVTIIHI